MAGLPIRSRERWHPNGMVVLSPTWAVGIRCHLCLVAQVSDTIRVAALPACPCGRYHIADSFAYQLMWAGGIRWQVWGIAHVGRRE